MKYRLIIAGLIGVAILAFVGWRGLRTRGAKNGGYRTARVERGDLVQTVRATGVVQPIRLVQVGTQVNGPVRKLYVDYNDRVKEGDLVAQIDPTVYEARLAQDEANLAQCLASVDQAKSRLVQAEKELARARQLIQREMLSQAELEAALAGWETLVAQLKVAEATVEQARASLRLSKANLDYTTLRSPVNGVVISRNVNEGQTVVASMSAQTLFVIATDLKQIQVEASIPEADIGKLRMGQPVTFSVDAHEDSFTGQVSQVRLSASTVQNVVTYPVVIRAANPDDKLFPGMTANIVCEVARRTNVLKVANAALRFKPSTPPTGERKKPDAESPRGTGPRLWVQDGRGNRLKPLPVKTGISDGTMTEVCEPAPVEAGREVIAGAADTTTEKSEVVNPFAPRMPGGGRPPR
jgi:HlyD family secretion protein